MKPLTAETITNAQIRELRMEFSDPESGDVVLEAICAIALGQSDVATRTTERHARTRCADLLNTRAVEGSR